jgi:hypothetical protein
MPGGRVFPTGGGGKVTRIEVPVEPAVAVPLLLVPESPPPAHPITTIAAAIVKKAHFLKTSSPQTDEGKIQRSGGNSIASFPSLVVDATGNLRGSAF